MLSRNRLYVDRLKKSIDDYFVLSLPRLFKKNIRDLPQAKLAGADLAYAFTGRVRSISGLSQLANREMGGA